MGALLGLAPGSALAAFGFEELDVAYLEKDGSMARHAGSHPFALTTTLRVNTVEASGFESPDEELRDLSIDYPLGLVAMPSAVPACSNASFMDIEGDQNACSDSTAIGIGGVTASATGPIAANSGDFLDPTPIYKLTPVEGSVARIGFIAAGQPIVAELGLRPDPPYNGFVRVSDLTESALFYSARMTVWGVPADPDHDPERGQCAFVEGNCPANIPAQPFLTLPRSCTGPMETSFRASSWDEPAQFFQAATYPHDDAEPPGLLGLTGCGNLLFSPQIDVQPTTDLADAPTGLDFDFAVFDEGLLNPGGLAQTEMKKLVLDLPEGMIVNPGVSESLVGCTPTELAQETMASEPGDSCPLGSQVGTVEVETPLLPAAVLEGKVFAGQGDALYVVIKDPGLGILVKQVGEVDYDPFAEQLTSTFDDLPQLPVSSIDLRLDDGLLLTPAECDEFVVPVSMSPWSRPEISFVAASSFEVVAGPDGGACPSGREPPVAPGAGGSVPLPANQAVAIPPPLPSGRVLGARRPCPHGRRRVAGKVRCVRRRCHRARQGKRAARRCARPSGRRRR